MSQNILGISAFYHDAAAALLKDGHLMAAAQEERFTRKKHDPSFPTRAIAFCLKHAGLSLDQIDVIVFYDKPFLKFERLLETYYVYAPKGLRSFLSSMPVWIKEKLFLKKLMRDALFKMGGRRVAAKHILFSTHHLSHAASAFFPSPFKEAAILTVDGVGEWSTATIAHGNDNNITLLRELRFPHSVGLLYSAFTYYLGFKVNSGEYKLMGLSPYGDPTSPRVRQYKRAIKEHIVDVKDDGSIWLNQEYFDYCVGLKMIREKKWEALFGVPRRAPESDLESHHCDLALAIQQVTEEIVLNMARTARKLTGATRLCLAGGVALNCVANAKILKAGIFEDLWIQPAAGDAGGALGAAYAIHHIYYGHRRAEPVEDNMRGSYLGPSFSCQDVEVAARKFNAPVRRFENFETLCDVTADLLAKGNAVGWFQGKMEWGPRALGNRSIIGDARSEAMQKRLNLKIKFRESFRPFAPSVLHEDTDEWFDIRTPSPYMLLVADVREKKRKTVPHNYHHLPLKEKLYCTRSDIPAITHVDYSARLQTVHPETNPRYARLIQAFKKKTGYGLLINTSFNVRGEPLVCTPEEAYTCFMRTDMDYLVVENFLFTKEEQPTWHETRQWQKDYILD